MMELGITQSAALNQLSYAGVRCYGAATGLDFGTQDSVVRLRRFDACAFRRVQLSQPKHGDCCSRIRVHRHPYSSDRLRQHEIAELSSAIFSNALITIVLVAMLLYRHG